MALTGSGQLSFNDVRIEMSQSAKTDYALSEWAWGYNEGWDGANYAPINVLSSGSRFSESNPLNLSNLSMSAWYGYDHTPSINIDVTGTLYSHADFNDLCPASTMLIVNAGTSSTTLNINITGSNDGTEQLYVYYGKPWNNTGANGTGSATFITSSEFGNDINMSFNYTYNYNASSGSNLYFVLFAFCG
jgi:hypothetical protein